MPPRNPSQERWSDEVRFRDTSELIEWAVDRLIAVRLTSRPKRKPKLRRGHVGVTRRYITLVVRTCEADDVIGASVAYATVTSRWPITTPFVVHG
jgi:hypothetical protein